MSTRGQRLISDAVSRRIASRLRNMNNLDDVRAPLNPAPLVFRRSSLALVPWTMSSVLSARNTLCTLATIAALKLKSLFLHRELGQK